MKQNVCKKIETTKTNNVSYDYEWVLLCTVVHLFNCNNEQLIENVQKLKHLKIKIKDHHIPS